MKNGAGLILSRAVIDKVTGKSSVVVVPPATSLAKTPATTKITVSKVHGFTSSDTLTTRWVTKVVKLEPLTVPSTVKV